MDLTSGVPNYVNIYIIENAESVSKLQLKLHSQHQHYCWQRIININIFIENIFNINFVRVNTNIVIENAESISTSSLDADSIPKS